MARDLFQSHIQASSPGPWTGKSRGNKEPSAPITKKSKGSSSTQGQAGPPTTFPPLPTSGRTGAREELAQKGRRLQEV